MQLAEIVSYLDDQYPASTAEEWDNVGLLVGDTNESVAKIMTCLTITPNVCREAVDEKARLIIAHHPFPFRSLRRITSHTVEGRILLELIRNDIAVYSPHTAHDSATDGVNRQLADMLGLVDVEPLNPNGSGRIGNLSKATPLSILVSTLSGRLGRSSFVGDPNRSIRRVAIGCGAADEFVGAAATSGADMLLLGEARFHTCLQAESLGLALILPGHYGSERFAVESLADKISARFPEISCFASRTEQDVIRFDDNTARK